MDDGAERTPASELRTGWPTLTGAALGLASGALTIFYYTQGLFFGPLAAAFGWTRAELSAVNLVGGFEIALASVLVGWIVDRHGVRAPALAGYAAVTLAFVGLSLMGPSLAIFVVLQLIVIGFGAANGPASYTRAISRDFVKARGVALGLAFGSVGVAAVAAPVVIAWTIQTRGWRAGYQALALITALAAPLVLGLLSRGERPRATRTADRTVPRPGRAALLGEPAFLRLAGAFTLTAVGLGGLTLHLAPILTDAGFSLVAAGRVQGMIGLSVLLGRLATGYLLDRLFAPRVAALTTALAAAGLFGLAAFGGGGAWAAAALAGLAMGAEGDVIGYVTARYFGLTAYGRRYGLLYGAYTIGLGLGAFLMGQIQSAFGGYGPALWFSGAVMLAGAALLAGAPPYPAPPASEA